MWPAATRVRASGRAFSWGQAARCGRRKKMLAIREDGDESEK